MKAFYRCDPNQLTLRWEGYLVGLTQSHDPFHLGLGVRDGRSERQKAWEGFEVGNILCCWLWRWRKGSASPWSFIIQQANLRPGRVLREPGRVRSPGSDLSHHYFCYSAKQSKSQKQTTFKGWGNGFHFLMGRTANFRCKVHSYREEWRIRPFL